MRENLTKVLHTTGVLTFKTLNRKFCWLLLSPEKKLLQLKNYFIAIAEKQPNVIVGLTLQYY